MIYVHLVGLGGHYHLYITQLDPTSMFAGGFEVSGASTAADGEWLLNLPWIAHMLATFGPACECSSLALDETFLPTRASVLF